MYHWLRRTIFLKCLANIGFARIFFSFIRAGSDQKNEMVQLFLSTPMQICFAALLLSFFVDLSPRIQLNWLVWLHYKAHLAHFIFEELAYKN
mmetsp:Transcript_23785/g.54206  ORF Transcript_23785/g.54206 Transcript_23785/m.54206 type:complete len:92 (-) Transcript_23785:46-321(-)